MDINSFREFVVLADTGNYMVAADKLYLTQSTLSRHIQSFEKDLGAPVFERTTRKVTLNEYGQIMLPYARQITSIQDEYSVAIYNQIRIDHDNIRIGTIPMMVSYGITDALAEFRKRIRLSLLTSMNPIPVSWFPCCRAENAILHLCGNLIRARLSSTVYRSLRIPWLPLCQRNIRWQKKRPSLWVT